MTSGQGKCAPRPIPLEVGKSSVLTRWLDMDVVAIQAFPPAGVATPSAKGNVSKNVTSLLHGRGEHPKELRPAGRRPVSPVGADGGGSDASNPAGMSNASRSGSPDAAWGLAGPHGGSWRKRSGQQDKSSSEVAELLQHKFEEGGGDLDLRDPISGEPLPRMGARNRPRSNSVSDNMRSCVERSDLNSWLDLSARSMIEVGRQRASSSEEYGFGRKGARRRQPSQETWELLRGQRLPPDFEENGCYSRAGSPLSGTPRGFLDPWNARPLSRKRSNSSMECCAQAKSDDVRKAVNHVPETPRRLSSARVNRLNQNTSSNYFAAVASGKPGTPPRSPLRHPTHRLQEQTAKQNLLGTSLPGCCNEADLQNRITMPPESYAQRQHRHDIRTFFWKDEELLTSRSTLPMSRSAQSERSDDGGLTSRSSCGPPMPAAGSGDSARSGR